MTPSPTTPLSAERIATVFSQAIDCLSRAAEICGDHGLIADEGDFRSAASALDMASRSLNAGGDAGGEELVARLVSGLRAQAKIARANGGFVGDAPADEFFDEAAHTLSEMQIELRALTAIPTPGREVPEREQIASKLANDPEREPPTPGTRPHLIDGEFQSDKYPTTPRGKVPLSVKDKAAQDLLWEYAQRRRVVDADFAADLEEALRIAGFTPGTGERTETWRPIESAPRDGTPVLLLFKSDLDERWAGIQFVGRCEQSDLMCWRFAAPVGMGGFPAGWLAGWKPLSAELLSPPPETEDAIVERVARAHWNENPAIERAHTEIVGTAAFRKHDSYVLWDDEDMREHDRELWRRKTKAALAAMRKPT